MISNPYIIAICISIIAAIILMIASIIFGKPIQDLKVCPTCGKKLKKGEKVYAY